MSTLVWRQRPVWKRVLVGGGMSLGWPFVTLIDALRLSSGEGDGPGFGKLYAAALTRNFPPNQYALYALLPAFDPAQIADILLPLDFPGLHHLSGQRGARVQDVQDKARFEQICRAHDLACIPTLATFSDGASSGEENLRAWTGEFFVKSLSGNRGAGAERWSPAAGRFESSGGRTLAIDEIIAELRPTNSIIQPVVEDSRQLRELGSVALSSLRLVTARGASISATPIAGALSLADEAGSLTSHAGTLCGIDVETGTVTVVRETVEEGGMPAIKDDSSLIGVRLPSWRATIDLACRAHDEAFPAFVTLGWDVALTQDGPVLLETNVSWNIGMHQTLTGPLGRSALAEVIDELLLEPAEAR